MHVRAALLYNHWIQAKNLMGQYEKIVEGDKIKFLYLQEPNPIGENGIGFVVKMPKELDLHRFVDYNTQFEKSFLEPLNAIVEGFEWHTEHVPTLFGLFED